MFCFVVFYKLKMDIIIYLYQLSICKSLSYLNDLIVNEYWVLYFDRIVRNSWKNFGVVWKMYKKVVSRQFSFKKRKFENVVLVY